MDDISLLELTPLGTPLDARAGFLRGSLPAGTCPSSASFLMMFMMVGRNLVDKEMRPGSCKERDHGEQNCGLKYS